MKYRAVIGKYEFGTNNFPANITYQSYINGTPSFCAINTLNNGYTIKVGEPVSLYINEYLNFVGTVSTVQEVYGGNGVFLYIQCVSLDYYFVKNHFVKIKHKDLTICSEGIPQPVKLSSILYSLGFSDKIKVSSENININVFPYPKEKYISYLIRICRKYNLQLVSDGAVLRYVDKPDGQNPLDLSIFKKATVEASDAYMYKDVYSNETIHSRSIGSGKFEINTKFELAPNTINLISSYTYYNTTGSLSYTYETEQASDETKPPQVNQVVDCVFSARNISTTGVILSAQYSLTMHKHSIMIQVVPISSLYEGYISENTGSNAYFKSQ